MATIALEFVPPRKSGGAAEAKEDAQKAADLMKQTGIDTSVDTFMYPGMIAEEEDRPVSLEERLDTLPTKQAVDEVVRKDTIVTQVTAFASQEDLGSRIADLTGAGINRIVFVGVPRTMADGQGPGLAPTDALSAFSEQVPGRGIIFIPTRDSEKPRFEAKATSGANFALTQLLYSPHVVDVMASIDLPDPKPEILLSFGYVPKSESKVGLINWLIKDETDAARAEMDEVARIAPMDFAEKKRTLLDIYKRITDQARKLDFPLGVHLEAPYGFSKPAFETFAEMLDYWNPKG
jgi:hypothetical protein